VVGCVGVALAFAFNALSPHGLVLGRNYSPGGAVAAFRPKGSTSNSLSILEKQLRAEGLQLADSTRTVKFFNDPARDQGRVIFVDARDDEHYQAGHIPGAFQLDHYHPENYLAALLPACQAAEQIVVYCKGGSCEDSEQTAIFLRDAGVPKERLFVYAGGYDDWSARRLPIESGARGSGQSPAPAALPGGAK